MPKSIFVCLALAFLYSLGAAAAWVILLDSPVGKIRKSILIALWIISIPILAMVDKIQQIRNRPPS